MDLLQKTKQKSRERMRFGEGHRAESEIKSEAK